MSSAMSKPTLDADTILKRAAPVTGQHAHEIQPFGHLVRMPIALSEHACKESVDNLNQLLADTMTLRDVYKKHHWQVAGPAYYQLDLLFDKHYDEQNEVVDAVAERISTARRRERCDGARCRRDDARSSGAEGAGRSASPSLAPAARARDRAEGGPRDGTPGG